MLSEEMKNKVGWGFSFDNPFDHNPFSNEEWMINKEKSSDDFLLIQGYDANLYPTPDLGSGARSSFWYDYTIHNGLEYINRTGFQGTVQLDDVVIMESGKIVVEDKYAALTGKIDVLYQTPSANVTELLEQASVMNQTLAGEDELYLNVGMLHWDHKFMKKRVKPKNDSYHIIYELLSDSLAHNEIIKRPVIIDQERKIKENLSSFLVALLLSHRRVWVKYEEDIERKKHRSYWDHDITQFDLR